MDLARLAATFLAVSSLGCASLRPPLTPPSRGGAAWSEVSSAHFVLRTDADPADALAMTAQFERLWTALAHVTRRPPVAAAKIELVRFERRKDMFEIMGHKPAFRAYFTSQLPGDLEPRPTLVLPREDLADENRETFLHELTHRFLHERFASLPVWLNEGLAQYHETLRAGPSGIVLGEIGGVDFSDRSVFWESSRGNDSTLQVPAYRAPKVWDLINDDWTLFYAAAASADPTQPSQKEREQQTLNYAAAYKLVHYFLNGPDAADRARFASFLAAVERGERARGAFLETFGAELPRLEEAFHRYLTATGLNVRNVNDPGGPTPAPVTARTMSDAEIHLLWARLLPRDKDTLPAVRRELDEALASEPGSPEVHYFRALFSLGQDQLDEAGRELDAALAARPDEPRYLLARVAWHERHEQGAASTVPTELLDHLVRTATSASQLRGAAYHLRLQGRVEEGFRLIDWALAADPLCWACQETRALLLADAGKLDLAVAAMDRVMVLLPETAPVADVVALRRKMEVARSAAAAGPPPQR